jgi:hypothetical protein
MIQGGGERGGAKTEQKMMGQHTRGSKELACSPDATCPCRYLELQGCHTLHIGGADASLHAIRAACGKNAARMRHPSAEPLTGGITTPDKGRTIRVWSVCMHRTFSTCEQTPT